MNSKKAQTSIPAIIVVAVGAILLHMLYYLSVVSSPVIRSDAWRYVDKLVMSWSEIGFNITDLFYKKHILKTALPFHKLTLYFDYRFFDLNFRLEALIGFVAVGVICILTVMLYFRKIDETHGGWLSAAVLLCAIVMLTSMNVTEAYTWPLVMFAYCYFAIAMGIAMVVRNFRTLPRWFSFLISAIGFFLLGDALSIILWFALAIAMCIACIKDKTQTARQVAKWIGISGALVFSYYLAVNYEFIFADYESVGEATRNGAVAWGDISTYGEIFRIVFSSVLVHKGHLAALGEHATSITYVLALVMLILYLRFFIILLLSASPLSTQKFVCLVLVLYGTASVLGILVGRTALWGLWTLHETRYLLHSQVIAFGLLVDLAFELTDDKAIVSRAKSTLLTCGIVGFVLCQLVYFKQAHSSVPWLRLFQENQVRAIADYAIHQPAADAECSSYLTALCGIPHARRLQVLAFVENNDLNVFNPGIQLRHRLSPYDSADNVVRVEDWGPRNIDISRPRSEPLVFWLRVSRLDQFGRYAILLDDVEMPSVASGRAITFSVPSEQLRTQGPLSITLIDTKYGHRQHIGSVATTP
ncbi:MAG: hypothetical protein ACI9DC_003414 [Gammaproteobacteria bacterium]|jgi:hypothetical protein